MFIAIFKISINAIKFDEITVTFHPKNPNKPIIIINNQLNMDSSNSKTHPLTDPSDQDDEKNSKLINGKNGKLDAINSP